MCFLVKKVKTALFLPVMYFVKFIKDGISSSTTTSNNERLITL